MFNTLTTLYIDVYNWIFLVPTYRVFFMSLFSNDQEVIFRVLSGVSLAFPIACRLVVHYMEYEPSFLVESCLISRFCGIDFYLTWLAVLIPLGGEVVRMLQGEVFIIWGSLIAGIGLLIHYFVKLPLIDTKLSKALLVCMSCYFSTSWIILGKVFYNGRFNFAFIIVCLASFNSCFMLKLRKLRIRSLEWTQDMSKLHPANLELLVRKLLKIVKKTPEK